jgi:hypothetical protein
MFSIQPRLEALESRVAPATFTVTKTADSGTGSLRDALAKSDASPGPDTIVFKLPPPPLHGANIIALTSGELTSIGSVTITGPGSGKLIIDANNVSRVFEINDGNATTDSPTTISGLSIINGNVSGALVGGGIFSYESLALKNVVISGNAAGSGAGLAVVDANSVVNIDNCFFSKNKAIFGGGGLALVRVKSIAVKNSVVTGNQGANSLGGGMYAAIYSNGTGISISHCIVTGNSANAGGGVYVHDANPAPTSTISISGSTISGNSSTGTSSFGGGGLLVGQGHTIISGSTIANNTALYTGGGVHSKGFGTLTISKSTITGNRTTTSGASYQGGGGIFVLGDSNLTPQPVKIVGSRISDNQSARYGGGLLAHGGIALTISASTLLGNRASQFGGGIDASGTGTARVDLTISGGAIANNVAAAFGGGINAYGDGAISITAAKVSGNVAEIGGGIYANSSAVSVTIASVAFAGNLATNGGGGLEIANTGDFNLRGGSFQNNGASSGGGIQIVNSTGSILGVSISDNAATNAGGGVFQSGIGTVTLQIAKVHGNTAPTDPQVSGTFTFV